MLEQIESQEKRVTRRDKPLSSRRGWILMGLGLVMEVSILGSLIHVINTKFEEAAQRESGSEETLEDFYRSMRNEQNTVRIYKSNTAAQAGYAGGYINHLPTYGGISED